MKYLKIVLVHVLICVCVNLNAQNSKVKYAKRSIPTDYLKAANIQTAKSRYKTLLAGAFDLTSLLPRGYRKDGTVDYTKYLQEGLDKYAKVVFPNFPIMINDKGLNIRSNSIVLFPENSKITLKPSRSGRYELLRIHDKHNVEILFPKIDGNRDKHLGHDGEWGVGISIYSSKDVKIYNPQVENCWGDGITVSKLSTSLPSQNIKIFYPRLNHNRRNGLSIASAINLEIINPVISNTYGIPPMAAIDIEPASQAYTLQNILIESPITFNSRYGIILALTRASGKNSKPIDIKINNHLDHLSTIGFRVARFKPVYKQNPALKGTIIISNPIWKENKMKSLEVEETFNLTPTIIFKGGNVGIQNKKGQKISKQ